ncbi:MAG: VTT domain-containing protein [archaeon]
MDLSMPASLLAFIQVHGYTVLFLIIILEGSFVTYLAGFAASLGFFNVYALLFLAPFANTLADSVYYLIGKYGRSTFIYRFFADKVGAHKVQSIENHLKNHIGKTLFVIKFTPFLPVPGLMLCGAANVPFKKIPVLFIYYQRSLCVMPDYAGILFRNGILHSFQIFQIRRNINCSNYSANSGIMARFGGA